MSVREVHYVEFDCTREPDKQRMIGYETLLPEEAPSPSDAAPEGGRAHRLTDCWCGNHHAPEDLL